MRWDESAGQELGAKQGEMIVDGNCLSFCVEVVYWCCFYAAGCYSKSTILSPLEPGYGCLRCVGEPDGCGIGEDGSNEGPVGDDYCFFLLAPVGASKCSEDIETGSSAGDEL